MSSFEFVFSLFGLLLGLALAEGLGGLAKALKARHRREVLAGMFAANALLLGATIGLLGWSLAWLSPRALVVSWSFFPLTLLAMFARDRRVIMGALGVLLLLYPLAVLWR